MLIPTQGKGVSSRSFFEADFGTSPELFVQFLAMPEDHLGWRGHFVPRKNETKEETQARKIIWDENQQYLKEWTSLFEQLGDTKEEFIKAISDNNNSTERYETLKIVLHKKLFIHYFSIPMLLKTFTVLKKTDADFIVNYISVEFPLMYTRMVRYISKNKIPYSFLEGVYRIYGKLLVSDIFKLLSFEEEEPPFVIGNLSKIQIKTGIKTFDFNLVKYTYLFFNAGIFTNEEKKEVITAIKKMDERKTREIIKGKFEAFKTKLLETVTCEEVGVEFAFEQLENTFCDMYSQLSLFEDEQ